MERLKSIKRPPLKDKFKKYGDSFELVSKNECNRMYCYRRTTPEGIVYFEVFRSTLVKDEKGEVYESYHNSAHLLGVFVMVNMHRRKSRSICKENMSNNLFRVGLLRMAYPAI